MRHDAADEKIYRYMEFKHLQKWFGAEGVRFNRPEIWSDKTENPLLASLGFKLDGEVVGFNEKLSKMAFAQCWTYEKEIEEWCWKSYSQANDVIRIGVGKQSYVDAVKGIDASGVVYPVSAGVVAYHQSLELYKQTMKSALRAAFVGMNGPIETTLVWTLFQKLTYHQHEKEFRVVLLDQTGKHVADNFLNLRFKPRVLSIDIGPNCSEGVIPEIAQFAKCIGLSASIHNAASFRNFFWDLDA